MRKREAEESSFEIWNVAIYSEQSIVPCFSIILNEIGSVSDKRSILNIILS